MADNLHSDPVYQKFCAFAPSTDCQDSQKWSFFNLQAELEAEVQRHVSRGEMLQEELIQRTKEAGSLSQQLQMAQALHRDQAAAVQVTHAACFHDAQQDSLDDISVDGGCSVLG